MDRSRPNSRPTSPAAVRVPLAGAPLSAAEKAKATSASGGALAASGSSSTGGGAAKDFLLPTPADAIHPSISLEHVDAESVEEPAEEEPSSAPESGQGSESELVVKERVALLLQKKVQRASLHIISFLRIYVRISSRITFPVTVDAARTIEYLASQIEAEYAFRYTSIAEQCRPPAGVTLEGEPATVPNDQLRSEPLIVGLLCDASGRQFNFQDTISNVLNLGDTVVVVNGMDDVTQAMAEPQDLDYAAFESKFDLYSQSTSQPETIESTSDNRFLALLRNMAGLTLFREFATTELALESLLFWLEVEIFTTTAPELQPLMAKYIFFMYIADHAPLVINISKEMRADIAAAVTSYRDTNMFDEAQLHAYTVLKKHVFPKFERTEKFREFLRFRTTSPQAYFAAKIRDSFSEQFKPNLELMLEICGGAAFAARGTPVYIREKFMNRVVKRYFPSASAIEGYWNNINHAAAVQRVRKVTKERKLAKFFGTDRGKDRTLLQDEMVRQLTPLNAGGKNSASPSASAGRSYDDGLMSDDDDDGIDYANDNEVMPRGESNDDKSDGDDDLFARVKRRGKLEQILGEKVKPETIGGGNGGNPMSTLPSVMTATLGGGNFSMGFGSGGPTTTMTGYDPSVPSTMLRGVGLANPAESTSARGGGAGGNSANLVAGTLAFPHSNSASSDTEVPVKVVTLNELPTQTKAMLTRRSKKLRHVLGEALDENTAYESLMRELFNPMNRATLDRRTSGTNRASFPAGGGAVGPSGIQPSPTAASFINRLAEIDDAAEDPVEIDPFEEDAMMGSDFDESDLLNSESDSEGSLSDLSSESSANGSTKSRLKRVKRRGKLEQILGEGKLPATAPHSRRASAVNGPNANKPPRKITKEDRVKRRKRVNKLEKVFGQLPPVEALTELERRTIEHRRSIASISRMLSNGPAMASLIDYLVTSSGTMDTTGGSGSGGGGGGATSPLGVGGGAGGEASGIDTPPQQAGMRASNSIGSKRTSLLVPHSLGDPNSGGDSSSTSLPSANSVLGDDDEEAKQRRERFQRKRKFNKLNRFFGNQVDPALLIEQNIIENLERQIHEDVGTNEKSMSVLRSDLALLREQVKQVARSLVLDELEAMSPPSSPIAAGPSGNGAAGLSSALSPLRGQLDGSSGSSSNGGERRLSARSAAGDDDDDEFVDASASPMPGKSRRVSAVQQQHDRVGSTGTYGTVASTRGLLDPPTNQSRPSLAQTPP
ncbi:hypothetical protein H9P43_007213 [Blastocladiella emersonii ATCC 22665]|nr:hypothetical protein H9P43_007213 [Blastocladiella emersonii ATCC 22665]